VTVVVAEAALIETRRELRPVAPDQEESPIALAGRRPTAGHSHVIGCAQIKKGGLDCEKYSGAPSRVPASRPPVQSAPKSAWIFSSSFGLVMIEPARSPNLCRPHTGGRGVPEGP
jgi:hypothetical protein